MSRTRHDRPAAKLARHALALCDVLIQAYPEAYCALEYANPLQLLIATMLSAQCTDARVNMVTPALFARFPAAKDYAEAPLEEIEAIIRSTGFYRNKAKGIKDACTEIVSKYAGEVPRNLEALTNLRGVGRKTANVVLGNAFGIPGIVVDTHVKRLSNRLGLTAEQDPVKIEFALMRLLPEREWVTFGHRMILHGRKYCKAPRPKCQGCPLLMHCPFDKKIMKR